METIIKFKNVTFKNEYDDIILQNLNFEIKKGEIIILTGESNTGKTLLFKLISTLIIPKTGKIEIFNNNINSTLGDKLLEIRKHIGLLFQNNALFDNMTVLNNIIFPLMQKNYDKKKAIEKAKKLLSELDLYNTENLYPDELSGGMKKRVALARMIINDPDILLFDDPTAGLDPVISAKIFKIIKDIYKKDKTMIIISQDTENLFKLTDKIMILKNKEIAYFGNKKNLKKIPEEITDFLNIN